MGKLSAIDMANYVPELTTLLVWHLRSNHYPPVPLSMVPVCAEAIDAYIEEDVDRKVALPDGVEYRGETSAPAWAIIEAHHLDDIIIGFVLGDDDEQL